MDVHAVFFTFFHVYRVNHKTFVIMFMLQKVIVFTFIMLLVIIKNISIA